MSTDEQGRAQAEEYLAELPDDEFAAVLKRVRPPQATPPTTGAAQQFASFIARQLNGDNNS